MGKKKIQRQKQRAAALHALEFNLGVRNDPPPGYEQPGGVFVRVGGFWIKEPDIPEGRP